MNQDDLSLRHALATLAYRAAKPLRDIPEGFSEFRPCEGARSAGEILTHLCELMDWALSQAKGAEKWVETKSTSWDSDSTRFFAALTALDTYLASNSPLHTTPQKLFQGPVADALTHVGQIALMRRLAGATVRPENYYKAEIVVGKTDANQNPPVREF